MELIRQFVSLSKNDAGIAGGKGASLGEMTQAGIPVPPGFVLLSGAFERFLDETDLDKEIEALLSKVNHEEMHTVEHASAQIQSLIKSATMPEDISSSILQNYKMLGAEFVAVRSSATAEDGATAAWAGQLDTFLNTTEAELLKNVQHCWASLFTPRAIFYRFEKGMHDSHISVAVVVQKMVQSEISGIAFSVHPVTEDYNQLIIEAGYGLGEAIVSGQVTPDSYVVEKEPCRIIDTNVSTKTRGLYKAVSGNEWRNIPRAMASAQVLTEEQILELSNLILRIETHYGFPCDIEWAYEANRFYITQSRPITTLKSNTSIKEVGVGTVPEVGGEEQPLCKDFELIFEAKGLSLGLIELICLGYVPDHSVITVRDGHMKESYALEAIARMNSVGANRFISLQSVTDLEGNLHRLFSEVRALDIPGRIESSFFQSTWRLLLAIHIEYGFFDVCYTDGIFERSKTDSSLVEVGTRLGTLKNDFRALYNAVFFEDVGFYRALMSALSSQYGVPLEELQHYRKSEIDRLFDGLKIARDSLDARSKAYVFYRTPSNVQYLEGQPAEDFINRFGERSYDKSETIRGLTAHKTGEIVRGKVFVLELDYADLSTVLKKIDLMQKGDILVANTTAPEVITACKKASAIVTDAGGMLSHAAVVAREFNVPCIVGTQSASKVLKTGDMVEVDAEKGIVRVVSE